MNREKIAFVGGGRIVRILLQGWSQAGCAPTSVHAFEPDAQAAARLASAFPEVRFSAALSEVAAEATVVFLAVHPPHVLAAVTELGSHIRPETLVISLSPKISLTQLSGCLPATRNLARCLPNAPSIVGAGFNPIALPPETALIEIDRLRALLKPLGHCPVVPEQHLEAYAVLTAMGPTYFWFQLQELRQLAGQFGLTPAEANVALDEMIKGAAQTLIESGLSVDEVIDLVPVKPLHDDEQTITDILRARLSAVYRKLMT